ncbi:MAG TPA: hypothetical protein VG273_25535 [Bryobacteraceae bacterium]|jgi:hypothetical protein|nr:hypothetical protein [Bryobacteraceae bacterium]
MQTFNFEQLDRDLDVLANYVAAGDSRDIQIRGRQLAEALENYGDGTGPGSITAREIAEQLRKVEHNSEEPHVAAPHMKEAIRILRASDLRRGTAS